MRFLCKFVNINKILHVLKAYERRNIYISKEEQSTKFEVRFETETVWLYQVQIVNLFDCSKANISEHMKHMFQTKELKVQATVRNFRTVQIEGGRTVNRLIAHCKVAYSNPILNQFTLV